MKVIRNLSFVVLVLVGFSSQVDARSNWDGIGCDSSMDGLTCEARCQGEGYPFSMWGEYRFFGWEIADCAESFPDLDSDWEAACNEFCQEAEEFGMPSYVAVNYDFDGEFCWGSCICAPAPQNPYWCDYGEYTPAGK